MIELPLIKEISSSVPQGIWVLYVLTFVFVICTILLFLFILFSRLYKAALTIKKERVRRMVRDPLIALLFEETEDFKGDPDAESTALLYWNIRKLFKPAGLHRRLNRNILLEEILNLHKSISGDIADRLRHIYLALGFRYDSAAKLRHPNWSVRAFGITELMQMRIRDAYYEIFPLTSHPVPKVRMQARLAMVRLAESEPLSFIDADTTYLSKWEQINIHSLLTETENVKIPDFRKWLNGKSDSTVIFSIQMASYFNQGNAIPDLIELLKHPHAEVRREAVRALGDLQAYAATETIMDQYIREEKDVKSEILQAVLKLFPENILSFLEIALREHDYELNLVAATGLTAIGEDGRSRLRKIEETAGTRLREIIIHALDGRI